MAGNFRIGTRKSPLAIKQVDEVKDRVRQLYPDRKPEVVAIDTSGDKDRHTPISDIEGTDFFTREIDQALLKGEIDVAVHSAKDLPDELAQGLGIAFTTESIDPYDCLVSKSGLKLDKLPHGARIGTSSQRRKAQLKKYREDFQIIDIRGNIEERLNILDNYDSRFTIHDSRNVDAIVIAAAGLIRLGLEHRITQRIPLDILRPHPLQGSLAVVAKSKGAI